MWADGLCWFALGSTLPVVLYIVSLALPIASQIEVSCSRRLQIFYLQCPAGGQILWGRGKRAMLWYCSCMQLQTFESCRLQTGGRLSFWPCSEHGDILDQTRRLPWRLHPPSRPPHFPAPFTGLRFGNSLTGAGLVCHDQGEGGSRGVKGKGKLITNLLFREPSHWGTEQNVQKQFPMDMRIFGKQDPNKY